MREIRQPNPTRQQRKATKNRKIMQMTAELTADKPPPPELVQARTRKIFLYDLKKSTVKVLGVVAALLITVVATVYLISVVMSFVWWMDTMYPGLSREETNPDNGVWYALYFFSSPMLIASSFAGYFTVKKYKKAKKTALKQLTGEAQVNARKGAKEYVFVAPRV